MGFMLGATFDTPFQLSANPSGEYKVKDILDHCSINSGMNYLAKKLGYPIIKAILEHFPNLINCPNVLSAHEGCRGLRPTKRGGWFKVLNVSVLFFCNIFVSANYWLKMLLSLEILHFRLF